MRKLLLIGAAALIWAIWTSRNDIVFDNTPIKTYMQVLFRRTHWLRLWVKLQRHEEDSTSLVMEIFANFG
jgi:hypothetical protein